MTGVTKLNSRAGMALQRLRTVVDSERGATMTEYGLLLVIGLITAFLIVKVFGETVLGLFENYQGEFDDAYNPGDGDA